MYDEEICDKGDKNTQLNALSVLELCIYID